MISGINLVSGGTLSVFQDCLSYLDSLGEKYHIIALVHKKELFQKLSDKISFIEYPIAKKNWLFRCFYEYFYFYFLSKKIKPYLWLSLHDITPNVKAKKMAVYCHNPSPFYSIKISEMFLDKKFTLFTFFYSFLYEINIKKNDYVIVQQEWLRQKFKKMYKVDRVIVSHPKLKSINIVNTRVEPFSFIYPTYPRIFKNIEVICEAFKLIDNMGATVYITIDGSENQYSKKIVEKYSYLKSIKFIGIQKRENIFNYYGKVAALIFPSKLETWGLPMSEFSATGKPIFASNTEFCRETLSNYSNAAFFMPDDAIGLSKILKKFIGKGEFFPDSTIFQNEEPYVDDWEALFKFLLK